MKHFSGRKFKIECVPNSKKPIEEFILLKKFIIGIMRQRKAVIHSIILVIFVLGQLSFLEAAVSGFELICV